MVSKRVMSLMIVLAITNSAAIATPYNFNGKWGEVEYWAGSGNNEAIVVVDFDIDESFAFSYKWNGSATGWDALDAIDTAGSLDVDATWYEQWSCHFINDFSYPDATKGTGVSWGYYASTDGESWTLSGAGVDGRELSNGAWDGWSWGSVDENWNHLRAPTTPVPEPTSAVLLALGGLVLRRRRA